MEQSHSRDSAGIRLAAQYEVARILADADGIDQALRQVLAAVCNYLRWDVGAFWLVGERTLSCRYLHTRVGVSLLQFDRATIAMRLEPGQGLPGRILVSQKLVWLPNLSVVENFPRRDAAVSDGLKCGVGVPIRIQNEVFGVIEFFSRTAKTEEGSFFDSLESIASQVGQFLARKQREEKLRESEHLYRTINETAPDGIITINEESTIVMVNPAVERIFGYSAKEMIGQSLTMLMPEDMAAMHRHGIMRYLSTGKKNIPWHGLRLPGRTKEGQIITLEIAFGETELRGRRHFTGFVRAVPNQSPTA